jgi:hypothetical protein
MTVNLQLHVPEDLELTFLDLASLELEKSCGLLNAKLLELPLRITPQELIDKETQ